MVSAFYHFKARAHITQPKQCWKSSHRIGRHPEIGLPSGDVIRKHEDRMNSPSRDNSWRALKIVLKPVIQKSLRHQSWSVDKIASSSPQRSLFQTITFHERCESLRPCQWSLKAGAACRMFEAVSVCFGIMSLLATFKENQRTTGDSQSPVWRWKRDCCI